MTRPTNGLAGPFEVHCSAVVLQAFQALAEKAAQAGNRDQFAVTLRAIRDRLRTDPLNFGEPLYRLPALKLSIRACAVPPLVVHFGVHESRPLVIIQHVKSFDDPE